MPLPGDMDRGALVFEVMGWIWLDFCTWWREERSGFCCSHMLCIVRCTWN